MKEKNFDYSENNSSKGLLICWPRVFGVTLAVCEYKYRICNSYLYGVPTVAHLSSVPALHTFMGLLAWGNGCRLYRVITNHRAGLRGGNLGPLEKFIIWSSLQTDVLSYWGQTWQTILWISLLLAASSEAKYSQCYYKVIRPRFVLCSCTFFLNTAVFGTAIILVSYKWILKDNQLLIDNSL